MDIKRMKINRIVKVMEYGATYPLHVIAEDNKDFILKTKQVLHGSENSIVISDRELFTEIFCYMYLHKLKIDGIPNFCFLEIDNDVLKMIHHFKNSLDERERQAYLNISNSLGLNLGIEFICEARKKTANFKDNFKELIINCDARLMNTDRDKNNPNIIEDANGKEWFIDFGFGFDGNNLFDELLSKDALSKNLVNEKYFSKCCFDNYLFDEYRRNVNIMKKQLTLDSIKDIIEILSKELNLLTDDYSKEALAQIIFQRQSNKGVIYAHNV